MEESKNDVFQFIVSEEASYLLPVEISPGYEWSMAKHIKLSLLYSVSQYETGNSDDKPFRNIIQPILNLQYRAEGFDVKDIVMFVNSAKDYYKSFLIKKFHTKWARDNAVDTFIDDMVESYVDFGGVLVKDVNDKKPEVVPLQRIAFCDQTDILSGPICEKHNYSPDQLKEMESQGWGDEKKGATISIDDLIVLAEAAKKNKQSGRQTKTPGKYIEVYELHGMFPEWWLDKEYSEDEDGFTRQLHIIAYYKKENGEKQDVCLYKGKEGKLIYKFEKRTKKIYGRALGIGGAEELFEPQVWINYDVIRMKDMLDAASKVIFQTADKSFAKRNKLKNLDNLEILTTEDGKRIDQINTTPANIRLFENSIVEWEESARQIAAANETISGDQPPAGTPFKLQELVTAEAHSLHEYRKGKLATFLEEIYRDWIIPHLAKEVNHGQEFIAELDLDELQGVADNIITNEANKTIKEKILNGELVEKEEVEMLKEKTREGFMKGGNKKFIKILKEEMKDAPIDLFVSIVGKQKNLSQITDKLTNVWRSIIANPQILQQPPMAKLFNSILQNSGLDPIDFSGFTKPTEQPLEQQRQVAPQPVKENLARIQ